MSESPVSQSRKRAKRTVGERRKAVKPKKKQSDTSDGEALGSDGSSRVENKKVAEKRAAKRGKGEAVGSNDQTDSSGSGSDPVGKKATKTAKKKSSPKKKAANVDSEKKGSAKAAKPKKAKKVNHQQQTERDELPKLWDPKDALEKHGSYTFKVMSWNVAGLRAVMKNHPTALPDLATKHDFDVIFLQETKLQEMHVDDPKLKINGHLLNDEGYDSYYSCATAKKGYSGTVAFVKRRNPGGAKGAEKKQATLGSFFKKSSKATDRSAGDESSSVDFGEIDVKNLIPEDISYGIGEKHDAEGRTISLDFPLFTLTGLYVPNSGQKLERLDYRCEEWDTDLLGFMQQKEKDRNVPVIWLGDLNVAHTGMETWNEGAKHLVKSAGTTPQERESFERQLEAGFVDAFRELHPDAKGQYTYWSQRAGNRPPNKGLRLDYFICSKVLLDGEEDKDHKVIVRDSYILPDQVGSDHCPIILELEIRK